MDTPTKKLQGGLEEYGEPTSPSRYDLQELTLLSKEEIVQKVFELEGELNEFQESSKELEIALEEELQELELKNKALKNLLLEKDKQEVDLKQNIMELQQELVSVHQQHVDRIQEYEEKINHLKKTIVAVEIENDSMESNDRLLTSKLHMASQFNNELLEKIAIIENEYERKKREAIEKQLYISNYQNQVRELTSKITHLEEKLKFYENNEMDSLFLSMKDILSSGPPTFTGTYQKNQGMKKSDSLKKLHELTTKSEEMSKKVQSLKGIYSLDKKLKSTSTTQLSTDSHISLAKHGTTLAVSETSGIESRKLNQISASPSIIDLSLKLNSQAGSLRSSETSSFEPEKKLNPPTRPLETIKGSPNTEHVKNSASLLPKRSSQKKRSKKGLLDSFRSISISSN